MSNRKGRNDSAASAVKSFKNATVEIMPPDGVELRDDADWIIWKQFVKTRSVDAWREFDLVLLAKIVMLEADIRGYQLELNKSGAVIENQRGTPIENPLLRVIDTLQRQQLSIIRSMSLNQQASDPRVLNNSRKNEEKAKQVLEKYGVDSLIAMPH